jgi:hypothetical protein
MANIKKQSLHFSMDSKPFEKLLFADTYVLHWVLDAIGPGRYDNYGSVRHCVHFKY